MLSFIIIQSYTSLSFFCFCVFLTYFFTYQIIQRITKYMTMSSPVPEIHLSVTQQTFQISNIVELSGMWNISLANIQDVQSPEPICSSPPDDGMASCERNYDVHAYIWCRLQIVHIYLLFGCYVCVFVYCKYILVDTVHIHTNNWTSLI